MIDVFRSGEFAVLMQSFVSTPLVAAPFSQTVYSVRSVHKLSSWESGLYRSKRKECVLLEDRWFRPTLCGHGSVNDYILCMLHTQKVPILNKLFKLAVEYTA